MKVTITGASAWVTRMFEACGPYQWAREFLKNSLEAAATRIEFGIEWLAVAQNGVYRRTIADDGIGMDDRELLEFFSTLGAGAKTIGGIHDNFGVGAKIAALPWNPEGVVVISYKNGKGSMIWMMLEPESGDYELAEFVIGDRTVCVVDPSQVSEQEWTAMGEVNWGAVRPEWLVDHGTIIVLRGSAEHPDTVLGNPDASEGDIKGLSVYLNSRFWDLTDQEVTVAELRTDKKNSWPQGRDDRDDDRRPNNRSIMGAKHYLCDIKTPKGKLSASDIKLLDEGRVAVEWYLWAGDRPAVHSYAKKSGYIAVRYGGELYQLTMNKAHFRWFGIIHGEVQQNLTLILEPQLYNTSNGRWGVYPDQSRNRLIFTGKGDKGVELPLSDWGLEFATELPEPIADAVRAARGEQRGTIEDEDYRKRLQDKFGTRWMTKVLVQSRRKRNGTSGVSATEEDVEVVVSDVPTEVTGKPGVVRHRRKKTQIVVRRPLAVPGGPDEGELVDRPVDVPRWDIGRAEDFEKRWHLALWAPNDPAGPTVLINVESPILLEIVKHHQLQYPDVFAEEVEKTIHQVFGEVAACKIAHSQKLVGASIAQELLDQEYRNEAALTISLMGLIAEESLVSVRLGKLGRKKQSA
jgi:hypothetical protein